MRKHKTIHLKDIFWQQGASWFVSMRWEGKAAGYLASRLSMPPEVNQAIPPKLVTEEINWLYTPMTISDWLSENRAFISKT